MSLDAAELFAGFRWSLPVEASRHGHALDNHLLLNLWIALGLLTLVHIALFWGVFSRRQEISWRRSALLKYAPLSAAILLFAFFAVRANLLWAAQRFTGADPAALQVEVTGMQFAWYFRFPGRDATFGHTEPRLIDPANGNPLGLDPADPAGRDDMVSSELVLPAGREVDLTLRAQDVIHGFAVPELRLKQNAVPGQTQHVHFTPELPGTYAILCTQVCGLGHYRMQATLKVVPPAEFDRWIRAHQEAAR